jgi:hypothetical protein
MQSSISEYLKRLGPLRIVLALAAVVVIVLRPEAGTAVTYAGWDLVVTLLLPVLAPLLFMVIMLDALMSRVMMIEKTGAARGRYRQILWTQLLLGLALLLYWLPYFIAAAR